MTPAELQRQQAAVMMERELQDGVRALCAQLKLRQYHTWDSRRSEAGFPDSVIALPGEVICAELKREKKRPTADQVWWLDHFTRCGYRCFLWRPTHLLSGTIAMILSGKAVGEGLADGRWITGEGVPGDRFSLPIRKLKY